MKKQYRLIVFVIALLFAYDCNEDSPTRSLSCVYKYKGYDSTGNIINYGSLTIEQDTASVVTGKWHFIAVGSTDGFGPQFGDGTFMGNIDNENNFWLNLNPDFADNNVFLIGEIEDDGYVGTWNYSTFIGLTNHGTFKAHK